MTRKEEYATNNQSSLQILKSFGSFEQEVGKDISEFTKAEVTAFLERMSFVNGNAKRGTLLKAIQYTDWCIERGYATENNWRTVRQKMRLVPSDESTHINRDEIIYLASHMQNEYEKAVLLGAYEGLTCQEIGNVTEDCINGNKLTVGGRTLTMSDEFIQFAHEGLSTYMKYTTSHSYHLDMDNPYLIKTWGNRTDKTSENARRRKVITQFTTFQKTIDDRLSYSRVRAEGIWQAIDNVRKRDKTITWENTDEIRSRFDLTNKDRSDLTTFLRAYYYTEEMI